MIIEVQKCTGCALCVSICPKKCIEFVEQNEHFFFPKIDEEKCINCNKCTEKCPVLNQPHLNNRNTKVYSAFSKDDNVLKKGSSGSIFYQLGHEIIKEGGVVYGAAFNEKNELFHIGVENILDLNKLCKSKYLQSNCNGIYEKVKKDLNNNKKVLFCGTPCQIAGVKNYLDEDYPNLILVDFICHGVPNQWIFNQTLNQLKIKYKKEVKTYTFRYKSDKNISNHYCKYEFEKNDKTNIIIKDYRKDLYYSIFKKYIAFRESCYTCGFATKNRISDITLGDFWGIEKYDKTIKVNKGVSMISIHTIKGNIYFDLIKDNNIVKEYNEKIAIDNNHSYDKGTKRPE